MKESISTLTQRFIDFLDTQPSYQAIRENEEFLELAKHLRIHSKEALDSSTSNFYWVAWFALPEPAVLRWISLHSKKRIRSQ